MVIHAKNLPLVKVCCIASLEEAQLAIQLGAGALGLVSAMPSGPGVISEALIGVIAPQVPRTVATFLLTSRTDPKEIVAQQRRCQVTTIQLCDRIDRDDLRRLREALPGIGLVQVIHVLGPESVDEATQVAGAVDALLLDSGDPRRAVKQLGGTGRVHDWKVSRRIRDAVSVPVFLAGGLTPENVGAAIAAVNPLGVDVCSGVRTEGRLDLSKLTDFFARVRSG